VLPGDELVDDPTVVTNHAITIPAQVDQVWPWLVQMGWHRGGWYTARWVDRLLFPANRPSAAQLVPDLQRPLAVGDRIPDGPPGTAWFVIEHVDPPRLLVLHSTTHVPAAWRARLGASIDWTWTFTLSGTPAGTRLLLRTRGRTRPWWLTAAYVMALVPRRLRHGAQHACRHQPPGATAGCCCQAILLLPSSGVGHRYARAGQCLTISPG
jgi:hypothetical protein